MTEHSKEIGFAVSEKQKEPFKIIGVGGAGLNVINRLADKGVEGAETIAIDTDIASLDTFRNYADKRLLIGKEKARGLGCGGNVVKAIDAANESFEDIKSSMKGTEIVFIVAGMGGGTGTGAAPVVAKAAKEEGAIVVSYIIMPLEIESSRRDKAKKGLKDMLKVNNTLIVIDSNKFVKNTDSAHKAFNNGNEIISTLIKDFVELITLPSLVGLDYADVKQALLKGGLSIACIGESGTENRAEEAAKIALNNPLLDASFKGVKCALINIIGGNDITLALRGN